MEVSQMEFDVSKLSPKAQQVVADGKITAQEWAGLTAAEKAELETAFSIKEAPAEGHDISLVKEVPEPQKAEKQGPLKRFGNWYKKAWQEHPALTTLKFIPTAIAAAITNDIIFFFIFIPTFIYYCLSDVILFQQLFSFDMSCYFCNVSNINYAIIVHIGQKSLIF